MLDRSVAPPLREIRSYDLPHPNTYTLDNGIPVYEVNMGTQDILKLELVFFSGRWFENRLLASKTTASMIREGSATMTGGEIAEQIDFYGGSIRFRSNLDTAHVQVYCLTKHLKNILPIVSQTLANPSFPQEELSHFIQRNQERLKVDLEQNDTVAYRKITEMMYGDGHPYGYNSTPEMYNGLDRTDLLEHYQRNYVTGNCFIIVSGKPDIETIPLINKYLGQAISKGKSLKKNFIKQPSHELYLKIPKKSSVQSAIRIGKLMFNRDHPDYQKMYILNTILGGYFGSRLNQNLREDKGYTYNIFSSLDAMRWDGYFFIGTEVKTDVTTLAIQEIYSEFARLRNELIPQEELKMVKNYMLGTMLASVDGAFNVGEIIKMMIKNDLPHNYYSNFIDTIKTVTAEELQALAQKYFQEGSFYEVIVG